MTTFIPNTYINPRWIAVPVFVPDSIANCYINGTGVADFSTDPDWPERLQTFEFQLSFTGDPPLEPEDVVDPKSIMVTVGLAHLDHDDEDSGGSDYWTLELVSVNDAQVKKVFVDATTYYFELDVVINAAYRGDSWIDTIAYEIDLLVYRPNFTRKKPLKGIPWSEFEKVARRDVYGHFHVP